MKQKQLWVLAALVSMTLASVAGAEIFVFYPDPVDLNGDAGLDHATYWTWGIESDLGLPGEDGETYGVDAAVLTLTNITNWTDGEDSFYAYLLNDPAVGVTGFSDVNGDGDSFAAGGWDGRLLFTWSDADDRQSRDTLVHVFTQEELAALEAYAADGVFGFGFDPDCWYFLDEVELKVVAGEPVPEPTSLALLGLGVAGVVLRKKFFA